VLHLHQVAQRTYTSKLLNMPGTHRDRGEPRDSAPPTPPGIRVRTTAVRWLSGVGKHHRVVRGRWPPSELRTLVAETRGFTRCRRHLRPAGAGFSAAWSRRDHRCYFTSIVRAFSGRKGTRLLRPLLTSAVRSDHLSMASVAEATHGRSPGVSSVAFRAQSPDVRFAPLMDMDFAVRRPLVRCWRLISGSCPSTRTFAPRFFQTPPRGGPRPCASLVLHLHQVAQRTYTSKLLNMPGTRRNRSAVIVAARSVPLYYGPSFLHS